MQTTISHRGHSGHGVQTESSPDAPLVIAGRELRSRLILGTGKYSSNDVMVRAFEAADVEVVTVAVRRVNLDRTQEEGILYHLDPTRAAAVYQQIGPTYADILLIPTFRSAIRAITAGNTAASLYSDGREGIAQQILEDVRRQVAPRGVIVENVLLRDLQLPETLKHAIEAKQQAQQEAQRMEYVLQREKQEAERKRVEAGGIKDFQDIVSQGISDKLLEWKGIEATMELVKSQNAKVIVVGNSKNGLPLIYAGESK